jgi:hypothetical protein
VARWAKRLTTEKRKKDQQRIKPFGLVLLFFRLELCSSTSKASAFEPSGCPTLIVLILLFPFFRGKPLPSVAHTFFAPLLQQLPISANVPRSKGISTH